MYLKNCMYEDCPRTTEKMNRNILYNNLKQHIFAPLFLP